MTSTSRADSGWFGDDFGQKVDLCARLREILRNYPEGTSIFKELIQNADDAGAREVRLLLDCRSHSTAKLPHSPLAALQGPSLIAWNDATFSETDFASIQRIGDSLKKESSAGTKTGRFGVGFNSVYHLTELPTFVSGRYVVMFDPQAAYLPDINPANPGKQIDFLDAKRRRLIEEYPDQWSPLRAFGCDVLNPTGRSYGATLFRFPLRTESQASESRLSKQAHSVDSIRSQLEAFREEAPGMLLFLKSVERLSVWEWRVGNDEPSCSADVRLAEPVSTDLRRRRNFVANTLGPKKGQLPQRPVMCEYTLNVVSTDMRGASSTDPQPQQQPQMEETWVVVNQLGGGKAQEMATSQQYQHMKLIPWAGVAGRIAKGVRRGTAEQTTEEGSPTGQAYCFLPLPVPTGLPVHANAYFELSSNRRDIWYGSDMIGDGRLRAEWNQSLLRELIAPCYVRLLTVVSTTKGPGEVYDRLWPLRANGPAWQELLDEFYALARTQPLLYTTLGKGSWVAPEQSVLIPPEGRSLDDTATAGRDAAEQERRRSSSGGGNGGGGEITRSLSQSGGAVVSTDAVGFAALVHVLLEERLPVVQAAHELENILIAKKVVTRVATPEFVRQHFRTGPMSSHPSVRSHATARLLLHYCTLDLTEKNITSLHGLPVLPAADGRTVRVFILYSVIDGKPLETLRGMGYPIGVCLKALAAHPPLPTGSFDAALNWLVDSQQDSEAKGQPFYLGDLVLGTSDPDELRLFAPVTSCFVSLPDLPAKARALLTARRCQQYSNVRPLTTEHLPSVLRYILPKSWREVVTTVKWQHGESHAPSIEFFQGLWRYLLAQLKDLKPIMDGLPLLPCNEECVAKLSAKLPLLLIGPAVPLPVLLGLRRAGLLTVHDYLVPILGEAGAAALSTCVRPPRRAGVLACVKLLYDAHVAKTGGDPLKASQSFAELIGAYACDGLRQLILAEPVADLTVEQLELIKTLPIFRVHSPTPTYVSIATARPLYLLDIPADSPQMQYYVPLLNASFLQPTSILEPPLLRRLGVEMMTKVFFLLWHFFPVYADVPADAAAKAILNVVLPDISALVGADPKFLPMLQSLAFLPNTLGKLGKCEERYDPEEELSSLVGAELFPHSDFCGPETLPVLRLLGLRTTLHFPDVVRVARLIEEKAAEKDLFGAIAQARVLFAFLNTNADRFFTPVKPREQEKKRSFFKNAMALFDEAGRAAEKQRQAQAEEDERQRLLMIQLLLDMTWVPVLKTRPIPYLPWSEEREKASPGVDGSLADPKSTRLMDDMWFCSSTLGIVEAEYVTDPIKVAFGWKLPLDPTIVARQLVAIAESFHGYAASLPPALVDESVSTTSSPETAAAEEEQKDGAEDRLQEMRQTVTAKVPVIYQRLSAAALADREKIRRVLHTQPWVFVGERFVQAEQVAFMSQVNASPYLYSVPQDLASFAPLLRSLGVRDTFGSIDYVQVLHTMAMETGAKTLPGSKPTGKHTPLTQRQLELAIVVVQMASDEVQRVKDWEVFVPDDKGLLARSTDLVYDDAPWMNKTKVPEKVRFAHSKIAPATGEKLGIKSLRNLVMQAHADTMDFGLPTEAFGQTEDLTRRLRHILELYPEGPSILSELVQNADDAGASTVRVMYNTRSFGTSSLLGLKMAPWQGPALYVYNDGVFSAADFHNIARIGQASKLDKVVSTGRFGLGFNAVYHCTDLPSIVSAEHLVIFDPHVKHLPVATRQQPGIRVKFVDTDLIAQFPDQFSPYEYFGCNLREFYKGSLFRFPLRTAELARDSEISKSRYEPQTVRELFASFKANISRFLIFLRNVDKIEVYLDFEENETGGPVLLYKASRCMAGGRRQWEEVSTFMAGPPRAPLSKEAFYSRLTTVPYDQLPKVRQRLEVTYQDGHISFDRAPLERRGRAVDEFLVVAGLRGGRALAMSVDPRNRHLKFVPFGGVAMHMKRRACEVAAAEGPQEDQAVNEIVVKAGLERRGQVFCFLPLPVDSGLPVFVNGYFELSSNRRDIWSGGDMSGEGKLRSDWNQALLSDVIAPLYLDLVNELIESYGGHKPAAQYYSIFPLPDQTQKHFAAVATRFLELAKPQHLLWSELGGGRWVPCQDALLVDMDDGDGRDTTAITTTSPSATATTATRLREVLLKRGSCLAAVPANLKKVLVLSLCCKDEVTPRLVRELLLNSTLPPPPSEDRTRPRSPWPENHDDAQFLLNYCASDLREKEDWFELQGLPLVPLADGSIGRFIIAPPAQLSSEEVSHKPLWWIRSDQPVYFVVDEPERPLFANAQSRLVLDRAHLLEPVASLFENRSLLTTSNVVRLAPEFLERVLSAVLPSFWRDTKEVPWKPEHREDPHDHPEPDEAWIRRLWSYLSGPRGAATSLHSRSRTNRSTQGANARGGQSSSGALTLPEIAEAANGWPILPVFTTKERKRVLISLDDRAPVLNLTRGNTPLESTLEEGLTTALATLGVRVVARSQLPESMNALLSTTESVAFVRTLTIEGVVDILKRLTGSQAQMVQTGFKDVDAAGRRALRAFFAGEVAAAKTGSGEAQEAWKASLKLLPIYEPCVSPTEGNTVPKFCALISWPHFLPPDNVDPRLATQGCTFLRASHREDKSLLDFLGVKHIALTHFYRNYVLPHMPVLAPDLRTKATEMLLNHLSQLQESDPEFVEHLKGVPFVPDGISSEEDVRLKKATQLYDPSSTELRALLEPDMFPAKDLCTLAMVERLRTLGLKSMLSLNGVLMSTKSVEELYARGDAQGKEVAVKRAQELLTFLSRHIDELAITDAHQSQGAQGSPSRTASGAAAREQAAEANGPVDADAANPQTQQQPQLPQEFIESLRSLAWFPVKTVNNTAYLPWHDGPVAPLARPLEVRPMQDAWCCSARWYLAETDVASRLLRTALGWDEPIPPEVLVDQLFAVSAEFAKRQDRSMQLRSVLLRDVQQIYERLQLQIIDPESQTLLPQHAHLRAKVQQAAWIYVPHAHSIGDFFPISRVAFDAPKEFWPYLAQAQDLEYGAVLRALGVKERFGPDEMIDALTSITRRANRPPPLKEEEKATVVALLKELSQTPFDERKKVLSSGANVKVYAPNKEWKMMPISELCYVDAQWLLQTLKNSRVVLHFIHGAIGDDVARSLGARSLRDALLSNQASMSTLPCPKLDEMRVKLAALAEVVSGEDDADKRAAELAVMATMDVLETAEEFGVGHVEVVLDGRTYGIESLLHPFLSETQGPALLFHFRDVQLGTAEIVRLTSGHRDLDFPRPYPGPSKIGEQSRGSSNGGGVEEREAPYWPNLGKGLHALFQISDCVQVLAGEELCMIDPCGSYLLSGDARPDEDASDRGPAQADAASQGGGGGADGSSAAKERTPQQKQPRMLQTKTSSAEGTSGVARRYTLLGEDLHERFSDQFQPFLSLPLAGRGTSTRGDGSSRSSSPFPFRGTLIRAPLRCRESKLSDVLPTYESLVSRFQQVSSSVVPTMLFAQHMRQVDVTAWDVRSKTQDWSRNTGRELLSVRVSSDAMDVRRVRRELLTNRDWKEKPSFSRLFKAAQGINKLYQLDVQVVEEVVDEEEGVESTAAQPPHPSVHRKQERQEQWLIIDAFAHPPVREMALNESFARSKNLLPLVSATVRLSATDTSSKALVHGPSDIGRAFVTADTGQLLGLPCHVHAPFVLCEMVLSKFMDDLRDRRLFESFERDRNGEVIGDTGKIVGSNANLFKKYGDWNRALLNVLLLEILPTMLTHIRDTAMQQDRTFEAASRLYDFWPYGATVPARLMSILHSSKLYERLGSGQYFLTQSQLPAPTPLPSMPTLRLQRSNSGGASGRSGGGSAEGAAALPWRFVKAGEASFFAESDKPLLEAFVRSRFQIHDAPYHIAMDLKAHNLLINKVSPSVLRRNLKDKSPRLDEMADKPALALEILTFCLQDCGAQQAREDLSKCKSKWKDLAGLPLLPLQIGTVTSVGERAGQFIIADEEQRRLLPQSQNRFVSAEAVALFDGLVEVPEFCKMFGLVKFTPEILARYIAGVLPRDWRGKLVVDVEWNKLPAPLSVLWFHTFWKFVQMTGCTPHFREWPLVPVSHSRLISCNVAAHAIRLLPDTINASLAEKIARQASAVDPGLHTPPRRTPSASTTKNTSALTRRLSRGASRADAVEQPLSSRSLCMDLDELYGLYKKVEGKSRSPRSHAGSAVADDGQQQQQGAGGQQVPQAQVLGHTQGDQQQQQQQDGAAVVALPEAGVVGHAPGTEPNNAAVQPPQQQQQQQQQANVGGGVAAGNHGGQAHAGAQQAGGDGQQAGGAPAAAEGALQLSTAEVAKRTELLRLLEVVKAPVLELAFFQRTFSAELIPTDSREATRSVISSLQMFVQQTQWTALNGDDMDLLLKLLTTSTQLTAVALSPSDVSKLRELPVFETVPGDRVPLGTEDFVMLDDRQVADPALEALLKLISTPEAVGGTAQLSADANSAVGTRSRVLKRKQPLDDLYKDINVTILPKSGIITKFLIPSLPALTAAARKEVLTYLKEGWEKDNLGSEQELVNALKDTPFIDGESGTELAKPSELMDPRSAVLKEMFEDKPSYFPPTAFCDPQWLKILERLGLKSRIDKDALLDYAQELENSITTPLPLATASKAARLWQHVKDDSELFMDRTMTKRLASIRCVPVEKPGLQMTGGASNIGPTLNREYTLVAFTETSPAKDRNLVWTIKPVLLSINVPPQVAHSNLGIKSPPPIQTVLNHLRNLCTARPASDAASGGDNAHHTTVLDSWVYSEPPVAVFQIIYSYLGEMWDKIEAVDKLTLKDLPCVPVGNSLVKASRLYFRLVEDLEPLMFEMPRAFGAYDKVFRELGTRQSPTIQDYVVLLRELQAECGDSPLNPNELDAVVKVVNLIASIVLNDRNADVQGVSRRSVRDLLKGPGAAGVQLVVPDDRSVLVPLESVVYDDASWLRGRVHSEKLRVVHPRVSLETCECYGILRISQVVREVLDTDFVPEAIPEDSDKTQVQLSETLASPQLARALALLMTQRSLKLPDTGLPVNGLTDGQEVHTQDDKQSDGGDAKGESSEGKKAAVGARPAEAAVEQGTAIVRALLHGYTVRYVRTLKSRFLHRVCVPIGAGRFNEVDEDITSEAEGSLFFIDPDQRVVMLAATLLPPAVTPAYILAHAVVSQILQLGSDGDAILAPLSAALATPLPELPRVLELLRLENQIDESRLAQLRRGTPGQVLLDVDIDRVELRPLRQHMANEIVAYQDHDTGGTLRYGVIVSPAAGSVSDGSSTTGRRSPSFGAEETKATDARRMDRVPELMVRVAPGRVQRMPSTQIYFFRATRPMTPATSAGGGVPLQPVAFAAADTPREQQQRARRAPSTEALEKAGVTKVTEGDGDKVAAGNLPVESTQLLDAIDEMLGRVNLSLSSDKKDLLDQNMKLQDNLKTAYQQVEGERQEVSRLQNELKHIQSSFHCQVCFEKDTSRVLAPCGHMLCDNCATNAQAGRSQCPFCRTRVQVVVPFRKPW